VIETFCGATHLATEIRLHLDFLLTKQVVWAVSTFEHVLPREKAGQILLLSPLNTTDTKKKLEQDFCNLLNSQEPWFKRNAQASQSCQKPPTLIASGAESPITFIRPLMPMMKMSARNFNQCESQKKDVTNSTWRARPIARGKPRSLFQEALHSRQVTASTHKIFPWFSLQGHKNFPAFLSVPFSANLSSSSLALDKNGPAGRGAGRSLTRGHRHGNCTI
jgi:hypothetical protein